MLSFVKRFWRWLAAALVLIAGAAYYFGVYKAEPEVKYRTAKLDKGDVVASVSASGTITAVSSVSVGSQVSGQIKALSADFNSEVKANQVIARLDPELFEYRVRQAQADLESARAQLLVAQSTLSARRADISRAEVNLVESKNDSARKEMLFQKQFISSAERDRAASLVKTQTEDLKTAQAQLEVARAQVSSAQSTVAQRQAGLDSAKADLERTVIKSPVDGIVIKRSIEVGQTVAASLQAPELFVIAKNLRDMQVEVAVDESDIGKIRQGMKATFTVDSFPGRSFEGNVTQVRKAAQTVQNVVTYTVVVGFSNVEAGGGNAAPSIAASPAPSVVQSSAAANAAKAAKAASKPVASNASAAPASSNAAVPSQGGQGGQGAGLRAARERLVQALQMTEAQQKQLDDIYSGMRERFMALRDMDDAARAAASAENRKLVREKTMAILTPAQQGEYKKIIAEQDAQLKAGAASGGGAASANANRAPRKAGTGATSGGKGKPAAAVTAASFNPLLLPGMTANVRLVIAEKQGVLRAPVSSLRFRPANEKTEGTASNAPSAAASAAGQGGAGGAGNAIRQGRERLEQAVQPSDAQKKQLDDIYEGMRGKFASLREMSEADRPKATAAIRSEMQAKIMAILTPEQKAKYEALLAQAAANRSGAGTTLGRGKLYVLDANGKPKGIDVRTGVSDGSLIEIVLPAENPPLKDGDAIIIGTQAAGNKPAAGAGGPRSPF